MRKIIILAAIFTATAATPVLAQTSVDNSVSAGNVSKPCCDTPIKREFPKVSDSASNDPSYASRALNYTQLYYDARDANPSMLSETTCREFRSASSFMALQRGMTATREGVIRRGVPLGHSLPFQVPSVSFESNERLTQQNQEILRHCQSNH